MKSGYSILLSLLMGCYTAQAQELRLFSEEMRNTVPHQQTVIMDFIERYFNVLSSFKQTSIEQKMADDKVYFRKGKIDDLGKVTDSMLFSISLQDRYYEVSWSNGQIPFITIVFPAQYDLIMGMSQEEAQWRFKDAILASPTYNPEFTQPEETELLGDGIYMVKNEMMEIESLTDAVYYNKVGNDYLPVFDAKHLPYSVANLFHGLIADRDYQLYIEQSVYGLSTISYNLPLRQWLNYCTEQGFKVFFGIEERNEEGVKAVVITHCEELEYNHLLSVLIPNTLTEQHDAVMKVRLTPYIPTHNVKNLYQQETTNHTKKTWN
ncbi:MAG: hypothetical protein Q4D30_11325 [Bacteroidales bacterium]|nr:hypothetical protein [Bacteroidales bacterium]